MKIPALLIAASAIFAQAAPSSPRSKRTVSYPSDATFVVKNHLGNLSPYFTPNTGIAGSPGKGMPPQCTITQVSLMHRHGSRYPLSNELPYIANLSAKINSPNISAALDKLSLPSAFSFLQGSSRWHNTLGTNDLTAPGRQQCFDHGVQFRLDYPTLNVSSVLVGNQDRVVESAMWWRQGYGGRSWSNVTSQALINEDNVTISWITPMNTCPAWKYSYGNDLVVQWGNVYLPPIAARLNAILGPVNMTADDAHGALYACAYDTAAYGNSSWCGVFQESEIRSFEYELDLLMRGAFGYGLPGDMGHTLGSLYTNEIVRRLTATDANSTYINFGHDTTIDLALAAQNLAHDYSYPAAGPFNSSRLWRTSYQVPFGAQSTYEKWNCSGTPYVRFLLNGAVFPLDSVCSTNSSTGACLVADFVSGTSGTRNTTWGSTAWNQTCGNPGF